MKKRILSLVLAFMMCLSLFPATVLAEAEEPEDSAPALETPELKIRNRASDGKPVLQWTAVNGAEKYEIYFAAEKNEAFSRLYTAKGLKLNHVSADTGKTYYYKVRAIIENGTKGEFSDVVRRTADLSRPDVQVVFGLLEEKIEVSWDHIDQAKGYDVYCSVDGGKFTKLLRANGCSITHGSAKRCHDYRYKVRALASRSAANSAWGYSETISPKLPAPKLSLFNDDDYKLELSWTPVRGADHYVLVWMPSSMDYRKRIETKDTQMVQYMKEGTEHYYMVYAVESNGQEGIWSDSVRHTCPLTHFKVTVTNKASTGKPVVKWNKMDGAIGYQVNYKIGKNSNNWKPLGKTTSTSITDTDAKVGKTYYYVVYIIYSSQESSRYSDVHYRTCDCARPVVKLSTNSADQPVLSWKKIDGAVKYEVYRSVNGGDFKFLSNVNGTKLTNTSAKPGSTCRYRIRALGSRSTVDSAWCYTKTITVK